MKYKGIEAVEDREFIGVGSREKINGKIYLASSACRLPYLGSKDVLRGEAYLEGYILEKFGEDITQITYIFDGDFKGDVSDMIKKTIFDQQGETASKIGPAMKAVEIGEN